MYAGEKSLKEKKMAEKSTENKRVFSCSDCTRYSCKAKKEDAYPPFCLTKEIDKELLEETVNIYKTDEEVGKIAVTSASIEGEFYCRMTRVEETIEFIKRMGYKKIGVASCVGLMRETSLFCKLLKAEGLDYYAVGCKIGAVDKTEVGVPNEKKSTADALTSPCAIRLCRQRFLPQTAVISMCLSVFALDTILCSSSLQRFRQLFLLPRTEFSNIIL